MRGMRCLGAAVASLLLAACPAGEVTVEPDAAAGDDAPLPPTGLTLVLQADQTLPAMVGDDVRLARVYLGCAALRAVTDADESKTTVEDVALEWTASKAPAPFRFSQAGPGVYSQVKLRIDSLTSGSDAIEIEGEVRIDDDWEDFEIESEEDLDVTVLGVDTTLAPGMEATITIGVNLAALVDDVDWSKAGRDGDTYAIDDDNSEMPAIRAALMAAFTKR